MEEHYVSYLNHLQRYQSIIDALKECENSDGWAFDSQANIAKRAGLTQPIVSKIICKMCKPGGVLEKRKYIGKSSQYRILFPDLEKEGPMAEIVIVYVLSTFLRLEDEDVKNKAKRCGVSDWTYQRARSYIIEDWPYIQKKDARHMEEFEKLIIEGSEKYKDRIAEAIKRNVDILR